MFNETVNQSYKDWIIDNIIMKARQIWQTNAPRNRNDGMTEALMRMMEFQKKSVLEAAFKLLIEDHDKIYFPKPAEWKKAIDTMNLGARYENRIADEEEEIEDRFVKKIEKEIFKMTIDFGATELGKEAKLGNWWGIIYQSKYLIHLDYNYLSSYIYQGLMGQAVVLGLTNPGLAPPFYFRTKEIIEKIKNAGELKYIWNFEDIEKMRNRAKFLSKSISNPMGDLIGLLNQFKPALQDRRKI